MYTATSVCPFQLKPRAWWDWLGRHVWCAWIRMHVWEGLTVGSRSESTIQSPVKWWRWVFTNCKMFLEDHRSLGRLAQRALGFNPNSILTNLWNYQSSRSASSEVGLTSLDKDRVTLHGGLCQGRSCSQQPPCQAKLLHTLMRQEHF